MIQNQIKLIASGTTEQLHDFARHVAAECAGMGVTVEIGAYGRFVHNPVTGANYPVANPPRVIKKTPVWLDQSLNEGDGVYRP